MPDPTFPLVILSGAKNLARIKSTPLRRPPGTQSQILHFACTEQRRSVQDDKREGLRMTKEGACPERGRQILHFACTEPFGFAQDKQRRSVQDDNQRIYGEKKKWIKGTFSFFLVIWLLAGKAFGMPRTTRASAGQIYYHWIKAMNTANYLGFTDWRLPTTAQPDATCSLQNFLGFPGQSGGTGCTGSEMGHLFNVERVPAAAPFPFVSVQASPGSPVAEAETWVIG